MGLLDDAIREHLELKRRHGADPEEVSRQEEEALGEARHGEFARSDEDAGPEEAAGEPEEATGGEEEAAAEPAEAAAGQPFDIEADEDAEPKPGAEMPAPGYDKDPWLEEERDEVPAEESLERPAAADEEGDDVLEETPEFLQETPEHDRLWFEQKPPRDFDWDK
jgi:hypothetical protein